MPISRAHHLTLEDPVTPHPVADPRVRTRGSHRCGVTTFPLSRQPSAIAAFKQVIAASKEVRVIPLRACTRATSGSTR
ncbi:hypothetical protein [Frigoribacterium sp. UYMn621]|uniref:hypothetical protein n=1 Tax=Frigoribacterium sp. UYMn621 TaxID=3156343 RepID=UPI003398F7D8